jgi:hypothetical protein
MVMLIIMKRCAVVAVTEISCWKKCEVTWKRKNILHVNLGHKVQQRTQMSLWKFFNTFQ